MSVAAPSLSHPHTTSGLVVPGVVIAVLVALAIAVMVVFLGDAGGSSVAPAPAAPAAAEPAEAPGCASSRVVTAC